MLRAGDGHDPSACVSTRARRRVEAGVADGSVVGVHYDPMLAKVIAARADARRGRTPLSRALRHMQLHGLQQPRAG